MIFLAPNVLVGSALSQKLCFALVIDGQATAGHYTLVTFDAARHPSGMYFSRLEFGGNTAIKRMMLMK